MWLCIGAPNFIKSTSDFGLSDGTRLGIFKFICPPNFVEISQSTAKLLLLPVCKNGCPPYWNSTSGNTPNRIVMKFCTGLDVSDLITHANFSDHRFRGLRGTKVEFSSFPLTCAVVFKKFWQHLASLWSLSIAAGTVTLQEAVWIGCDTETVAASDGNRKTSCRKRTSTIIWHCGRPPVLPWRDNVAFSSRDK